ARCRPCTTSALTRVSGPCGDRAQRPPGPARTRRRPPGSRASLSRSPRGRREGELTAAAGRWKDLAGIHEAIGIERVLEPAHRREVRRLELQRHVAVLLHADAVLARDRATRFDARGEDFEARGLRAFE